MVLRDDVLLSVRNLKTYFFTPEGAVRAVDGVDFDIKKGETLGLAGESGCGKTTTAYSIIRLVPRPGKIVDGEFSFEGENILKKTEREMVKMRGNKISMIFQEPIAAMNPVYKVGSQIMEAIKICHKGISKEEARDKMINLLKLTRVDNPELIINKHPHELDPGSVQRAMIAIALCGNPPLLLADEPTTTMDVTTEAQIIELLKDMKREFNISILYITHNLGVIARMADRVAIMYAGKIVELGSIKHVFGDAKHPYTKGLLSAFPRHDQDIDELFSIPGVVPNLLSPFTMCRFYPRCHFAEDKICRREEPELVEIEPDHWVRCYIYGEKS